MRPPGIPELCLTCGKPTAFLVFTASDSRGLCREGFDQFVAARRRNYYYFRVFPLRGDLVKRDEGRLLPKRPCGWRGLHPCPLIACRAIFDSAGSRGFCVKHAFMLAEECRAMPRRVRS